MRYQSILHIDDDEDDQEIFLTALQQVTDKVKYVGLDSAIEALKKLADKKITADVIFLDLNMPQMSGQEFLVELNKDALLRHIPVIVLSTSAHKPTINLMKDLGAHDFITKPDDFNELATKLRSILS